jgi:hypothetical protein
VNYVIILKLTVQNVKIKIWLLYQMVLVHIVITKQDSMLKVESLASNVQSYQTAKLVLIKQYVLSVNRITFLTYKHINVFYHAL